MAEQPIIIKRIKKQEAVHHSGSWKVAFADFMTAMMAFFLVMWIIGLDESTRSAIAGYFQDPTAFFKKQAASRMEVLVKGMPPRIDKTVNAAASKDADAERKQMEQLSEKIKDAVSNDANLSQLKKFINIDVTDEGLRLEFVESLGNIFFETGSANVKPIAKQLFLKVGAILGAAKHNLIVDGHTDAQPYSQRAAYNNWDLSQDRAKATLHILETGGVKDDYVLACRGFAARQLRDKKHPFSFINRRVSVLLPYHWTEERVVGSAALSKPVDSFVNPKINITDSTKR